MSCGFWNRVAKLNSDLKEAGKSLATSGPNGQPSTNIKAWVGAESLEVEAYANGIAAAATSDEAMTVLAVGSLGSSAPAAAVVTPIVRGVAFEELGVGIAASKLFVEKQSVRRLAVRAFADDGSLLPGRTVLDIAGTRTESGTFGALEFKLHPDVALSSRQLMHFPALARNGGIVVGKNGLPIGLQPGQVLSPAYVQRIDGPYLPIGWYY